MRFAVTLLRIALSFLLSPKRQAMMNLITLLSITALTLATATALLISAVMDGYRHEMQQRLRGISAPILVEAHGSVNSPINWPDAIENAAIYPIILHHALIGNAQTPRPIVLLGLDSAEHPIFQFLKEGRPIKEQNELVLGKQLAAQLGQTLRSTVTENSPVSISIPPYRRSQQFTVTGILDTGFKQHDSNLVIIPLATVQELSKAEQVTSHAIYPSQDQDILALQAELSQALGPFYEVSTWYERHQSLTKAIALERRVMSIIKALLFLLAASSIFSTLIMKVLQKARDIAILKALGYTPMNLMSIILILASLITGAGAVLGLSLGWVLSHYLDPLSKTLESLTGQGALPNTLLFDGKIPILISSSTVSSILLTLLVLTVLSALYPAYRASTLAPFEDLQHAQ